MIVYHEINPDKLDEILTKGLKRTSRGEKGDDSDIKKADQLLDARRPRALKDAGVSRDNNIYGYLALDGYMINIKDGAKVPINDFIRHSEQAVLQIDVNPSRCFISDIDLYDEFKSAAQGNDQQTLDKLADRYWLSLTRLDSNKAGDTPRRPEVMITYDVTPESIVPCSRP